ASAARVAADPRLMMPPCSAPAPQGRGMICGPSRRVPRAGVIGTCRSLARQLPAQSRSCVFRHGCAASGLLPPGSARPSGWRRARRPAALLRGGRVAAEPASTDPYREAAEAFARDGVVCVRGVLDNAQLADAVAAIDAVLAAPSPLAQVASATDDPGS